MQLRTDGGVVWITLNRPEVGNAITPDQRDRVLLAAASSDIATRAVVLTATGRAFCTGADPRASRPAAARAEGPPDRAVGDISRTFRDGAQRLVAAVLDCEVPVIAAVSGTAAGIGAHLALACDRVVAADTASFIEVFVRRGIVPDGGGAYLIPRLIGPHRTKELMFFGDKVPAADAERLGIGNRVLPADELEAAAAEWATRLAAGPTRPGADQVAGEPLLGVRPGRGPLPTRPSPRSLRLRGRRPGADDAHGRRPGGHRRLRRAPGPHLPRLVVASGRF